MPPTNPAVPRRRRLQDGQEVRLDFLGPEDRADLLRGFEGLSPRSRYLRFFSAMPTLPDFIADGLLGTDAKNHVAIGARLIDADDRLLPPVVGVARYFRATEAAKVADPAIAVVDDLHGLGLAKILLRALSATARSNGITRFRAQVLDGNSRIRSLLRAAGAEFVDQDDAVLTYEVDIRASGPAPRGVLANLLGAMLGRARTKAR